jgi:transposase
MPKFKPKSFPQGIFAPIFLCRQIQPGTFEYTLCKLIDNVLDLSAFDQRYSNDHTGAPAYDPGALLKVIFLAYSRGITSSRRISEECRENTVYMAMSGNSKPHHTTIAGFVSSMHLEVKNIFLQILLLCDSRGLIGREMFAIDGCKLPSNASKEWSGTQADFRRKKKKLETAIERILAKHRQQDSSTDGSALKDNDLEYIQALQKDIDKISTFLENNDDRIGLTGKAVKSNITDNESAKIHTSKGVIQGYVGVATVDKKRQVIVNAEAFGQGSEKDLLIPSIEAARDNFATIGGGKISLAGVKIVADNGFHSEKNMAYLFSKNIDGYVADKEYRRRDIRFANSERYSELQKNNVKKGKKFTPADFTFPADLSYCICPAGQRLYRSGGNIKVKDYQAVKFKGPKSSCVPCSLRKRCLRKPEKTEIRQVAYLTGKKRNGSERFTEKMKAKIDTEMGRTIYGLRLAVGEPPFANIRSNLRLDRFSLRGKKKVNAQWNLFCILHNLMKLHKYGGSFA